MRIFRGKTYVGLKVFSAFCAGFLAAGLRAEDLPLSVDFLNKPLICPPGVHAAQETHESAEGISPAIKNSGEPLLVCRNKETASLELEEKSAVQDGSGVLWTLGGLYATGERMEFQPHAMEAGSYRAEARCPDTGRTDEREVTILKLSIKDSRHPLVISADEKKAEMKLAEKSKCLDVSNVEWELGPFTGQGSDFEFDPSGLEPGLYTATASCPASGCKDTRRVQYGAVDIISVPEYLFASASYAVPIQFQLSDALDGEVRSVEVSFYADGSGDEFARKKQIDRLDLTCRTMVLDSKTSKEPVALEEGTGGTTFESYLPAEKLRGFSIVGSVSQNARFQVKVTLQGTAQDPMKFRSSPRDENSRVSRKFGDIRVPAFDIRSGDNAGNIIETSHGAFIEPNGRQRTTLVAWPEFRIIGGGIGREYTGYFFHRPKGRYRDQEHRLTTETANLPSRHFSTPFSFSYARPYWEGNPLQSVLKLIYSDKNEDFELKYSDIAREGGVFRECKLESGYARNTLSSKVHLRQHIWNNFYYGEYISRSMGVRYGGTFFVSYPGKSVPVLEGNKVRITGSDTKIPELAMDMSRKHALASGEIRLASGHFFVRSMAEKDTSRTIPLLAGAFRIGAAVPNPASPFFAMSSGALRALDGLNCSTNDGKAMARINEWYSIHGDGSQGAPRNDLLGKYHKYNNQGIKGPFYNTPGSGARTVTVGNQLSFWVDLMTMAQLEAEGALLWWGAEECLAEAKVAFAAETSSCLDTPYKIQIKLNVDTND